MPRAATPLSGTLRGLLSDGEWHPFHELYAAGRDLVSPEAAFRCWDRRYKTSERTTLSLPDRIEYGRRNKIFGSLHNMGAERRGFGYRADFTSEYRLPGGKATWPYERTRKSGPKGATNRRLGRIAV
jgi:hypothetical protein